MIVKINGGRDVKSIHGHVKLETSVQQKQGSIGSRGSGDAETI